MSEQILGLLIFAYASFAIGFKLSNWLNRRAIAALKDAPQ